MAVRIFNLLPRRLQESDSMSSEFPSQGPDWVLFFKALGPLNVHEVRCKSIIRRRVAGVHPTHVNASDNVPQWKFRLKLGGLVGSIYARKSHTYGLWESWLRWRKAKYGSARCWAQVSDKLVWAFSMALLVQALLEEEMRRTEAESGTHWIIVVLETIRGSFWGASETLASPILLTHRYRHQPNLTGNIQSRVGTQGRGGRYRAIEHMTQETTYLNSRWSLRFDTITKELGDAVLWIGRFTDWSGILRIRRVGRIS
ncbi:hypothetical protein JOM56_002875 [Amanita muscaria]